MKILHPVLFALLCLLTCPIFSQEPGDVFLVVLGTVQDAGAPHAGCNKTCCADLFINPDPDKKVVSLGLIDKVNKRKYLFEATPDMTRQMKNLSRLGGFNNREIPNGIFLSHAHIGHYTGLMYLGKEAMNADGVVVHAMPKMKDFLENNGPWSQLVGNQNIRIEMLTNRLPIELSKDITVEPIQVPHRDEYSETVGFRITGPNKTALFIPDIDKWEKWNLNIVEEVKKVDYALLDATFYDAEEINNRDISEIPHPFVIESMNKFDSLGTEEKRKIIFIHMNHTNPLLDPDSEASKEVLKRGFRIARFNNVFSL
ncbi:MBL fold metallo-hydrolase [Lutimonas zeaxanthinifaciens]|uniref:MBL fold metallo-hydrolase n=1 Tax=Lutimonas zeaxanthinifaciens TaxID=3060215 RepID=UPI00265D081D|nr:MBL fold metallo-hydrolase [Lutimonas sp. YSD2104]WKK67184.1 MBL fold metallo-hydrolase [Lutimonas sp. YSD2104]